MWSIHVQPPIPRVITSRPHWGAKLCDRVQEAGVSYSFGGELYGCWHVDNVDGPDLFDLWKFRNVLLWWWRVELWLAVFWQKLEKKCVEFPLIFFQRGGWIYVGGHHLLHQEKKERRVLLMQYIVCPSTTPHRYDLSSTTLILVGCAVWPSC